MTIKTTRILICGSGAGSHALAGMFSQAPDVQVAVFTKDATKAHCWQSSLRQEPLRIRISAGRQMRLFTADKILVTNDPALAAEDCDMLIFAVPAFTHAEYLRFLQPHLPDHCVIVGLPGQNGFEWEVSAVLGERLSHCTLINFDSFPWVCRLEEFAKEVLITGIKRELVGAIRGEPETSRLTDPLGFLQRLLGHQPCIELAGDMLAITLIALNAYSHPPIMYGRWHDWDGVPLAEPAHFYREVDMPTAELLAACSAEVVACAKRIMALRPEVDLRRVIPMYEWDMARYGDVITDSSNQMTVLNTNPVYKDIRHPMLQTEDGGYVPDFNHRFLSEDVPFGLAVIRGVTEIVGIPTPHIDKVLRWSQQKLNRSYLVNHRIAGKDLDGTRCPQKFGIQTLDELLDAQCARPYAINAAISYANPAPSNAVISELS